MFGTEAFIRHRQAPGKDELSKFVELCPSEAKMFPAAQELPDILWNPKFRYRIHNSLQLIPILKQINPSITPHPISL
jgi:hypothetical protein